MSLEANKEIVRRHYREFNARNLGAVDQLFSEDFVLRVGPGFPVIVEGRAAYKELLASLIDGLDAVNTIDDLVAEADRVVVRESYRCIHRGEYRGLQPTGKELQFTAIDIYRIVDGIVVEEWSESNQLIMLEQLGLVAEP